MNSNPDIKTLQIVIKGKVQGVFYRKHAEETGRKLNLSGFVMNRNDGSVYAEVSGNEYQLQEFINWCYKGSPRSSVELVNVEIAVQEPHTGKFTTKY